MEAAHRSRTSTFGDLEIRPDDGMAVAAGRPLMLSVREHRLLVALAERAGRIVSRQELFRVVWGGQLRNGDRSVDVYVHKLRVKLESALPRTAFIHTHVGFGYRFEPGPVEGRVPIPAPSGSASHLFHSDATGR